MSTMEDSIVGTSLPSGWRIVERRHVESDSSGGFRALSFIAENSKGERAFVKILDPRPNPNAPDQLKDLSIRLDTFLYERNIVQTCADRKMTRVIKGIEYDHFNLEGNPPVTVHYLLFEWADSDIRSQLNVDECFDVLFALRVLHHTTTAIKQLHWNDIAHQDVRPANVLVVEAAEMKLGDLGHARQRQLARPDCEIHCDPVYSSPERLYGAGQSEFIAARAADLYQLGSLILYLFTRSGAGVHLSRTLSPIHHWTRWSGPYDDVLPHLRAATDTVLTEVAQYVPAEIRQELVAAARQLLDPDPERRGHPINVSGRGPRYGLERYISLFDRLVRRAELELRQSLT